MPSRCVGGQEAVVGPAALVLRVKLSTKTASDPAPDWRPTHTRVGAPTVPRATDSV